VAGCHGCKQVSSISAAVAICAGASVGIGVCWPGALVLCRHVPQHEVRAGQQQGKAGHKVSLRGQQRDPRQAEQQPEGAQR
jgi:hypothetical protein